MIDRDELERAIQKCGICYSSNDNSVYPTRQQLENFAEEVTKLGDKSLTKDEMQAVDLFITFCCNQNTTLMAQYIFEMGQDGKIDEFLTFTSAIAKINGEDK